MATWSPNSSTRMVVAPIRNGVGGGERGVETLAISWGEHCSLAVTACGDIHGDTARPPPSLLLNGQGSPHTPCLSTPQHASLCVSPHPAFLLVPGGGGGSRDAPQSVPPSGRGRQLPTPWESGSLGCLPARSASECLEAAAGSEPGAPHRLAGCPGSPLLQTVLENSSRPMASRGWLSRGSPPHAPPRLARSPAPSPARPSGARAALGEGSLAYGEAEVPGHGDLGQVPRPRQGLP